MFQKTALCCLAMLCLVRCATYGQSVDSLQNKVVNFPTRVFGKITQKTSQLDGQLTSQTQKYLQKMQRREEKLKRKLMKMDSASAAPLFANSSQQYAALEQRLKTDTGSRSTPLKGPYMPYVDSMKTSLSFLQQQPQVAGLSPNAQGNLQNSIQQFQQLQGKMQDADQVQQFMQQRQSQIQQYLQRYSKLPSGVTNLVSGYKQQAYYYSQQLQAYKDELNDPDKLMKTGLQVLNKVPAFASFVQKNSMLASLCNIPSNMPAGTTGVGMPGRAQVLSAISGGTGANTPNVLSSVQQNVQSATGSVDGIRDKLSGLGGGGGSDLSMPSYAPNNQKTKSFLHRLQFGFNIQSQHSTVFYPTTTDLGLSLGYKIDNSNVIGIGASYKLGWGSDIQHVQLTSQGVGLRSFVDIKVKGTWYASGGFEYNYQQPFSLHDLPLRLDSWQKSGLIGVSKVLSIKKGVLKNTKFQLLWDFLSYQQIPQGQPIKFRIGYSF